MSLTLKQESNDFELVPEGVYTARCIKVIDLGTQTVEFAGERKLQPKVQITWEILDDEVKMKDGRPFATSKTYTASLHEKSSLHGDLVKWRGKSFSPTELLGFDISKLLGAYCMIQIIHVPSADGSKTYANISSIMATKERPDGVNPTVMFDISNPDMEIFESLPEYLKEKIRSAPEWEQKQDEDEDTADLGSMDVEPVDLKDVPF